MRYNGRRIAKTTFRGATLHCRDCGKRTTYPGVTIKRIKDSVLECPRCGGRIACWTRAKCQA